MIVREGSLVMQHVIRYESITPHKDWYLPILGLRANLVNEDIYYTSPVVFKIEEIEGREDLGKYTYFIALNTQVEVPETSHFEQEEFLAIGPAIYVRCSETEEVDDAYELLEGYAKEKDWELDPVYYHVSFDLFDDVIIDIYAVVKGADVETWS